MKHSSTSPFLLFAALLYLACAVSSASAQETDLMDLNLEDLLKVEVVSSASRYEQSLSDAPSSVTIVTRKDIQTFGYRTMAELINGVRGFYVTNDTNYSHTGVRGFGRPSDFDTRLLVLLNGHRLNDSIYASSLFGLDFMIDIDLVEQVEIVRGPSSSVYGTNAFFGVINIVTRKPDDVGLEVSSDIEKHDTYQERVSYGESFENGIELLASFTRFDSHGQDFYFPEFDAPETNNGIANNLDGEDGYSAYLQLSFEDFTISSGMVDRNKDVPAAPFETLFNDPIFTTQDQRFFIDAKYSTQLSEGTQFETRLFYDWYEYRGYYPYDYAEEEDEDPFYVTNKDFSRGERIGAQANVILTSVENNKIVVGTEAREVFNIDQTNVDVDPAYTYLDSFENETIWALYAQDEITLTDWATLHVGLRFDDYESIDSEISPRAGLIFHPSDSSNLKFLYGQAFRAPNAFELYYNDAETQKAPQNLKPEKIDTWEFVYEQQLDKNVR
ncbi:MAG: TonB-dependent receptor, partial [Bdellovibrionales bacterium]|nr:TonB-dependent receptor [Bdellovibrionales bacterium]